MKKFFSLVLALVMALSLTTVAWGADALALKDANGVIELEENTAYEQITDLTGVTKIVGATGATVAGIHFIGEVSDLTLENVTFTKDVYFAGGDVTNLTVYDCTFSNASLQLHMHHRDYPAYTAENLVVANCEFDGFSDETIPYEAPTHKKSSIWGQNLNGATFTGNTITGSAHNAIQFDVSVEGAIEISNNTISNTGDRALRFGPVESGAALIIKDNTVVNGTDDDGEVMKATSIADDVYVEAIGNNWGGGTVVNDELVDSVSALNGTTGVYAKPTYQGAAAVAATVKYYKAVDNKVNKDGTWKANGTVEYYTLSCDTMKYAKVNTLGEADVAVYTDAACKNATMYLKAIDVVYYGDGAVCVNFGDKCGQYDEDDTDYDDEKTYYTAFNQLYVGVAPGAGYEMQLMVNGQLVKVDAVNNITKLAHKAMITTGKTGIESVKCAACGLAAVKAGNYASIPAAVVAANLVVTGPDAAGAYWYFPVATAGATTDVKVESADTFDAGIALYVGMSVMAATGAVVLKKRED